MRRYFLLIISFVSFYTAFGQSITPAGPVGFCPGGSVTLTISGAPAGSTFKWLRGGVQVTGSLSTYNANVTGTYTAVVTRPTLGDTTLNDVVVVAYASPAVDFSFTADKVCSDTAISFMPSVTTGIPPFTYTWNFGDPNSGANNVSSSNNPSHQFIGTPGNTLQNFTVVLTLKDSTGCTATKSYIVSTKKLPDASINDYISTIAFAHCDSSNFTLIIDNTSTTTATNNYYEIVWGDGKPNYSNPTLPATGTNHTYTSFGYFNLNLTVTGQNGCKATKNYSVYNGSYPQVPFINPGAAVGKCVPFTYSVPSLPTTNPTGTIYIVSKNDGTPNDTLTSPLPAFYSHTFTSSSCGAVGGITPNTFKINIRAQNPCGFSDLTLQPITTNIKPIAKFSISPDTAACINSTLTFTNTSTAGITVDNAGVCNTATRMNWLISPATGWSLQSGSFGDPNPTNNPSTWGSTNLGILFSTPGQYTITIIVRNTCGNDTLTKTVCIQTLPSPLFTTTPLTACSPFTSTFSNTSIGLNQCGPKTFVWNVSKTSFSCAKDSVNDFVFASSTSPNSFEPLIRFNNQGSYNVSLSVTNKCGTFTTPMTTFTIKRKPEITLTAPAILCLGQSFMPSINSPNSCGGTISAYSWSMPGSSVPSSSSLSPGTVTYTTAGTYTISITVTNECGSVTKTQSITVNPLPNLTVPANIITCPGSQVGPLAFSSSSSGTTNFSWANSNTGIGLIQPFGTSNPIPTFTAANATANAISSTINVTATNLGCSRQSGFTITVNPNPTVTQPANQSVCNGASTTTIIFSGTGSEYTWTNNNTSIGLAASGSGDITSFPAINTGTTPVIATITVTPKTNNGANCSGPSKVFTITVNPVPSITASPTNPTSCASATGKIVISGLTAGTSYTVNYDKNGTPVAPVTQTAAAGGTITLNNLSAGIYANISVTFSGCVSNAVGPFTLSEPNPPATPTPAVNSPICAGGTLTFSTPAVSGANYTWTGPNSFSSNQQNPTIANATVAASGTYLLTVTAAGCTSAAGSVSATVNATPVITTAGSNSPVCTGNALNLLATTNFIDPFTWSWTGPNGFTSAVQNPSIASATTTDAGTYTVTATATSSGCVSLPKTVTVVVNPTPTVASAVAVNPVNCNTPTGRIELSGLTASATYTVTYTRNGTPVTANLTANTSGAVIINNLTSGIYDNIKVTIAGCSSNTVGPYTLVDPNPPVTPVATSNGPICSGSSLNLSASTTSTGAFTWSWTGPNGFVSTTQNPTISNAGLNAAGTYGVTAILNGCTSAVGAVTVVVNQTPPSPTVGNNSPVCAGGTLNLMASTTLAGTVTWSWTGPNGYTSNLQNPVISNVSTTAAGIYIVMATATQGACPSPSSNVQVVVHPALVNNIDTAAKTICYGQQVTVGSVAVSGANGIYQYQWEQSPDNINWTPMTGQIGATITVAPTASVYLRRKIASGPCQSVSLSVYITVQPPITNNAIQQDAAICTNTAAATLIGSVPVGANGSYIYQWESSTNGGVTWTAIAGGTGKDYVPGVLTITTKYRRTVTTTFCNGVQGSPSNVVTLTVNPDAKALFFPTDTLKCPSFAITPAVINLQTSTANSQYIWYANGTQIGTGATFPGYTILAENDSVVIKLKVISAYGCKNDSLSQKFKTVRKPTPSFTLTDTVGCGPISVAFTNTSTYINSYNYFWDFGNGQTSTQVQPGSITFAPNPAYGDTTYIVTLKVFSPCDTLTFAKSIRVKSKPKALFTPTKTVGCSPMTVKFKNTSKGTNTTYFWDFGDGAALSTTTPDTVQHTFVTGVVDTFYVKLKAVNECGADSLTYSIIVAPNTIKLNLAVNGTERFGCAPHAVSFINNSGGASVFLWNFGDGANTTTTKNVDTVRHAYLTPGTYTVTMQAINNCSDTTTTETIVVYPKPRAQFTANKFNVCIGDSVKFTNQSDSATAYLWKFGDGLTSTLNNPSHTYTTAGSYTVTLITYRNNPSGNVCTDSTKQTVTVSANQTGFFTVSDSTSNCAPLTVTMVNKNKPSVSALWDFGDGTTATGDSVVHTFQTAGAYLVKLTVKVPGGCTYITTRTITVLGPKGSLQYTGGYVCHPSAVQLQAVATGATSYDWDFGDGVTLNTTQQTVYHTYANAGFYLPKVTLNNGSCGITLKGLDTVKVDKVDGGFRWAQTQVCGATALQFTDTSHVFFGVQNIRWAFGDNTTGTGSNPSHSYAASGRYTVQMIVLSRSGCADTVSTAIDVTVKSKPVVGINAMDTACTRRSVAFNAVVQTVDPVNLIQWNVSNGGSGTGLQFNYTFTAVGTYTVRLIVGTTAGCYDTAYHTVRINPSPVVTATPSLDLCRNNKVQLNAIGAATWQWLPLSGLSCYTCANPIASPTITTPYVVEGKNSFGCADWDTVVVTVIQPLRMQVSPDDSICVGSSVNLLASGASSYSWSPAIGLNNTTVSNPTASPAVTTRYRVVGYDGYNCFTDTAFVTVAIGQYPTVNLGPDLTLAAGTLHPLATTVTNGPIRNWLWTPTTNLSCSNCALPVAEIKKDVTYTVKVTTAYGCSASDTVNIKVICSQDQVFIPNAFSPDGDGVNDVLMVRARGVVSVKYFRVFNRWGEMVFEQSNFKANDPAFGWRGLVNGKPAGPDVYVYTCEAMCENGALFSYKGNVSIIK